MNDHVSASLSSVVPALLHDLRGPLGTIRAALDLLVKDDPPRLDADVHRELLVRSLSSTERLLSIVHAVEELEEIDELAADDALLAASVTTFDVADVATESADSLEPGNGAVDLDVIPTTITGHRPLVGRAIEALAQNALTHTPIGTDVLITVRPDGEGATRIRVADDGPGVPNAVKERILRPFDRGVAPVSTLGTGSGLAVVAGIARLHGGTISVSDRAGGGAVFELELRSRPAHPPSRA